MVRSIIKNKVASVLVVLLLVTSSFVAYPAYASSPMNLDTTNNKSVENLAIDEDSELIEVIGKLVWEGGPSPRPVVYLRLFRNILGQTPKMVNVEAKPIIGSGDEISVTWEDMPKFDGTGEPYIYSVREYVDVSDDPSVKELIYGAPFRYSKTEVGLVVTNTYRELPVADNKTFIEVNKQWINVPQGETPTASFSLYDVNNPSQTITGTIKYPNTVYIFNDLPLNTTGPNPEPIVYEVREEELVGYDQSALIKRDVVFGNVYRVTANNIMDPSLGYNPTFVVTKPTGNQPYVIWSLNFVPVGNRAQALELFKEAAIREGANIGSFASISISDPITWISGPNVTYDVYPSDPEAGQIHIEILYNPDGTIADDSEIKFQKPKTWTQFVVGTHSALLFELTNTYGLYTGFTPTVKKALTGRNLRASEFGFRLYKDDVLVGSTVSNDASGNVVFPEYIFSSSDIGTHTFVIREVVGSVGGITYSSSSIEIEVEVFLDFDGELSTSYSYKNNVNTITNTYQASGVAVFEVNKILNGRALNDDEFTFALFENNIKIAEATNDSSGRVVFDDIDYDLSDVGVLSYEIKEVAGSLGGVTYSNEVIAVSVTVSDNGDGTLDVSTTYGEENPSFENTYAAIGSSEIVIKKQLVGRALKANEFTFDLFEGTTLVGTATNDATGTVKFDTLYFDLGDLGSKTYVVKERNGALPGVIYTQEEVTILMSIIDNGDGTLAVTYTYGRDDDTITNIYNASGSYTPVAGKILTAGGRYLRVDEFTFELKDESGTVIDTTTNQLSGLIVFDALSFDIDDVGKIYHYTIEEVVGTEQGMVYDPLVINLSLAIQDDGNGNLTITPTYSEDMVFNNTYRAHGSFTAQVSKVLTGRNLLLNEFIFTLSEGDTLISTSKNGLDGSVIFNTISYTQEDIGKVFTYTIEEVDNGLGGVIYDTSAITVTVSVTDGLNGDLVVTAVYSGTTFENTYEASGGFTPRATKVLIGGNRVLLGNEFVFELRKNGTLLQEVRNDALGNIVFEEIMFDESDVLGTHVYTISEKAGTEASMTYDDLLLSIDVSVIDRGNGLLNISAHYSTDAKFVNTYTASGTFIPEVSKVLEGRDLVAGEFKFALRDKDRTIDIATNDAFGNVEFNELTFDESDIGKTITYTIHELNEAKGGITYDDAALSVTLTITDGKNGTLDISAQYSGTTFNNTYSSQSVEVIINGRKTLSGRDLKPSEFMFELYRANSDYEIVGDALDTTLNLVDGKFMFDPLEFEDGMDGTYYYVVVEKPGTLGGILYDDTVARLFISVSDDLNGNMVAETTVEDQSIAFINHYSTKPVSVNIEASKELSGRYLWDGEFEFELLNANGEVEAMATNIGGKVIFNLVFDEPGTYTYKLREVQGDLGYIVYDDTVYDIEIVVTDDLSGNLVATLVHKTLRFENNYITNPRIDIEKSARLVNGKKAYSEIGEVIEFKVTATNSGDIALLGVKIIDEFAGLYGQSYMIIHLDGSITHDVTNGSATLLVGEKLVMVAFYEVTETDLKNRHVHNIAKAIGYEPIPEEPGSPRVDKPTEPDKPAEADVPGGPNEILPPTGLGVSNPMGPFMLIVLGLYLILKRKET